MKIGIQNTYRKRENRNNIFLSPVSNVKHHLGDFTSGSGDRMNHTKLTVRQVIEKFTLNSNCLGLI